MKREHFRRVTACVVFCVLSVAAFIFSAPATAVEVRESYIVLARDNAAALSVSHAMAADGLLVASTQLGAVDFIEVMLTATEAATWSRFAGVENIEINQKQNQTIINKLVEQAKNADISYKLIDKITHEN